MSLTDSILFRENPNPILIYEPDSLDILAVNPAAVKLYGYGPNEWNRMTLRDIRPNEDIDRLLAFTSVQEEPHFVTHEWRHQTREGNIIYVNISSQPVDYRGKSARLSIIHDITEQKETEFKLRYQQKLMESLIPNIPDAFFLFSEDGTMVDWNQNFTNLTGDYDEEIYDMHPLDFFGPRERKTVNKGLQKLKVIPQMSTEIKMRDRSGLDIPVWLSASRFEVQGDIYIAGIAKDLRPLREQEELAHASLEQLEHIFNQASVGMSYINEEGQWLRVNPKLREMLGFSEEEMKSKTFADLTHPDDLEKDLRQMEATINGEQQSYHMEKMFKRKDGKYIWCELTVSAIYNEEGRPSHLMKIIENIDQRKKVERQLQSTKELLNSAFNNMEDMVLITDPDSRKILDCNPAVAKVLGYEPAELIGKDVAMLFSNTGDYEAVGQKLRQLMKEHKRFGLEYNLKRKDGSIISVESSTAVLSSSAEGETRLVSLLRDVTERKQMVAELRRNLKEKETMLAEIHHRVKNNLALISALLQLQSMYAENDTVRAELEQSLNRIHSIARVHEDFYESEKLSEVEMTHFLDRWRTELSRALQAQEEAVSVVVENANLKLNINQAVPAALLLNELSNHIIECMKRQEQNLKTLLRIRRQEDNIHVEVDFSGIWKQGEQMLLTNMDHLSNMLIQALMHQLEAETSDDSENRFHFYFPIKNTHGISGHHFFH